MSAEPLGIAETGRHSRVRGDGFSWRTIAKIDALAMEIRAAGESSRRLKSMLDDQAVEKHASAVAEQAGASMSPSTRSAFLKKAFREFPSSSCRLRALPSQS